MRQNSGQQLSGVDGKNTDSRAPLDQPLWGCGMEIFNFILKTF